MYVLAYPAFAVGPAGIARPTLAPSAIVSQKGTLAPMAYVKYCVNNMEDCQRGHGEARITLTKTLTRQLHQVNVQVNREILPHSDIADQDRWDADVARGDCEDYVLTKRRKLIKLGWSPNALRIAVTYTPDGSGHAVLVVSTARGDLVLDNRQSAILDWRATDLRWVTIQSSENPLSWNEI